MKVLFLNPHIAAGALGAADHTSHGLVQELQAKGYAVLVPANSEEAWQMLSLHGASIDLAIVHREDAAGKNNEGGFSFIARAKADPAQMDLPILVTSHQWGDVEFARHQETAQGANAYLKWPFDAPALISMIHAMFGSALESEAAQIPSAQAPNIPTAASGTGSVELILEDASNLFVSDTEAERSERSIRLEEPDLDLSDLGSIPTASEILMPQRSGGEPSIELSGISFEPSQVSQNPNGSVALEFEDGLEVMDLPSSPSIPSLPSVPSMIQVEQTDHQAAEQMPYLFQNGEQAAGSNRLNSSLGYAQPLGDAVVPGGAAHAPDSETLKKYLLLREQDVAVLSSQLKAAKDQVKSLEDSLRQERGRTSELSHVAAEREHKLNEFEKEKQNAMDSLQGEIVELKFQLKTRVDKARILETQVREASDEMERLKDRVRTDIRKIRVREKELENRLEITKKDSEALISARENKIIELKRKLDLLEFNMDLLQDQHAREKENAGKLRDRLAKAAQVVRVAGGLLDTPAGAAALAAADAEEDSA